MRVLQFLAVVLTALAFAPSGAHLLDLPNKIRLSKEDYFVAQSIYRRWALFGIVIFTAIAANFLVALERWRRSKPYRPALVAGLILTATLVVFFELDLIPPNRRPPIGRRRPRIGRDCASNGRFRTQRTRSSRSSRCAALLFQQ